jgi:uncharacterized protein YicC (UPF0701 family)
VSYYENLIKALEARIEEMAMLNRMKAVSVEASLMIRIGELNDENTRLKAEVERLEAVIESHKDAGKRLLAMLDDERRKNAAKDGKPRA